MPTIIVQETFTGTDGTNITSHVGELGATWTQPSWGTATSILSSNRLTRDGTSGTSAGLASGTLDNDQYVKATIRMLTSISVNVAVVLRGTTAADTYYWARHNRDTNEWSIRKTVTGTATSLGTWSETLSAGDERNIEFRIVGTTLKLFIEGVERISVTDSVIASGKAGWRFSGTATSTTGFAIDNFEAGNVTVSLGGSVVGTSSVNASLAGPVILGGAVNGTSSVTASISIPVTLGGSVVGVGRSDAFLNGTVVVIKTANLQHGERSDGVTDYALQVSVLTPGTDIICVQERSIGDTGWDAALAAAGFQEAHFRVNGHGNDGPAIWIRSSTVTVLQVYDIALSTGAIGWSGQNVDKAAVAAKVQVGGKTFFIVSTHLAWSAGADIEGSPYSTIRVNQINTLLSWRSSTLTGHDVFLGGDLNFAPDYPVNPSGTQLGLFLNAGFVDLWREGLTDSKAFAPWGDRNADNVLDMPLSDLGSITHDIRRIDYKLLLSLSGVLSLRSITLMDTRAGTSFTGTRPSDHNFISTVMNLEAGNALSGTATGTSTVTGSLTVSKQLSGSAGGASTTTVSLTVTKSLLGSVQGTSSSSIGLVVEPVLTLAMFSDHATITLFTVDHGSIGIAIEDDYAEI